MRTSRRVGGQLALAGALACALACALAGCGGQSLGGPPEVLPGSAATTASQIDEVLASHGFTGLNAVDMVDLLDRRPPSDRSTDFTAVVEQEVLVIEAGEEKRRLPLPTDLFYLAVAPTTGAEGDDCTLHSLTSDEGEMADEPVEVRVVDADGEVLVDDELTTYANGFVGLWLPRDQTATLRVRAQGREGQVPISTDDAAPTCVTSLRLE